MKKIVVISDSFKGTMSSSQITEAATASIHNFFPQCEVIGLPVADGGEGTVECFLEALAGEKISLPVLGPWGEPVTGFYGRIGDVAVVEMAAAAGLPMVGQRLDPSQTTTYGVGQLMAHALEQGAKKIVLGLGGSATNDGGCGCAVALGGKFYNQAGESFCPVGATLKDIVSMDLSDVTRRLGGVPVEVMCDIDNPLCGDRGGAAIFGPQKGADGPMISMLDRGLGHMAHVLCQETGVDTMELPGAGAAGGFGAGAVGFFQAQLRPGIEVVLDMVDFLTHLEGCDLVITGEGRMDGQSLGGKVPVGVSRRAKTKGVPVVAIVGMVREDAYAVYGEGITAIFATNRECLPFEVLKTRGTVDYCRALDDVLRFAKVFHTFSK